MMMLSALLIVNLFASVICSDKIYHDPRIVGGYEIDIEQAPWQVSILSNGFHDCGGSIIDPKGFWILTAAHCTE